MFKLFTTEYIKAPTTGAFCLCYNMLMENFFKAVTSVFMTLAVYVFGGFDIAMQCLIGAIVIDYITGIIKAYYLKQLSSKIGCKGILKKFMILCVVAVGVIVDRTIGANGFIRTMLMYFFVANEALSILENAGAVGVLTPKFLKEAIETLKDKAEEGKK